MKRIRFALLATLQLSLAAYTGINHFNRGLSANGSSPSTAQPVGG